MIYLKVEQKKESLSSYSRRLLPVSAADLVGRRFPGPAQDRGAPCGRDPSGERRLLLPSPSAAPIAGLCSFPVRALRFLNEGETPSPEVPRAGVALVGPCPECGHSRGVPLRAEVSQARNHGLVPAARRRCDIPKTCPRAGGRGHWGKESCGDWGDHIGEITSGVGDHLGGGSMTPGGAGS